MARRFRPRLELLEDRLVLDSSFVWQDAQRLSLSFVQDGVDIVGTPNQLFQTLSHISSQEWQTEILRAFQTWAEKSNINFTLVHDEGLPFGAAGLPQGDSRFGDVRIGAFPQSDDSVAFASPADLFAGTWAGDVFLNSSMDFNLDGSGGFDLYSIFLHEIGHVLGLEHVEDGDSIMQAAAQSFASLALSDVQHIQELYGLRLPDEFEGPGGNNELTSASILTPRQDRSSEPLVVHGDLTTNTDVDVYTIRTLGNTKQIVISLQTRDFSLMLPRLTIYDADGNVVGIVERDSHFTGDLELSLESTGANQFYIQVEAADAGFAIGSYQLQAKLISAKPEAPPKNDAPSIPTGSPFETAIVINPYIGNPSVLSFEQTGVISSADGALFRFKIPSEQRLGEASAFVLTARRTDAASWQPTVQIFDRFGEPVAFETLINGEGIVTIQLRDGEPNHDYFIQINSIGTDADAVREFFLGIEFTADPVELTEIADGQTTDSGPVMHSFEIDCNRLVHFLLYAEMDGELQGMAKFRILDENGVVVGALSTSLGGYASATIFLPQGSYQLEFDAVDSSGQALAGVNYRLTGKLLSDPVGPSLYELLVDPVFQRPSSGAPSGDPQQPPPVQQLPAVQPPPVQQPPIQQPPPVQQLPAEQTPPVQQLPTQPPPVQQLPTESPPPVQQLPTQPPPVQQLPAEQPPPVQELPSQAPPVQQSPAEPPPVQQSPAEQTPPAQQLPSQAPPVQQLPAEQPPVQQTPSTEPAMPVAVPPQSDSGAPAEQGDVVGPSVPSEERPATTAPRSNAAGSNTVADTTVSIDLTLERTSAPRMQAPSSNSVPTMADPANSLSSTNGNSPTRMVGYRRRERRATPTLQGTAASTEVSEMTASKGTPNDEYGLETTGSSGVGVKASLQSSEPNGDIPGHSTSAHDSLESRPVEPRSNLFTALVIAFGAVSFALQFSFFKLPGRSSDQPALRVRRHGSDPE